MRQVPRLLCLGEPLYEFCDKKNGSFSSGFGGDISNVAVAASRSDCSTGIISSVGDDIFGRMFRQLWTEESIDHSFVTTSTLYETGLYFVTYNNGIHEFIYRRKNSAASSISSEFLIPIIDEIKNSKYIHSSGIFQGISNSASDAFKELCTGLKDEKIKISYDINYRPKLWPVYRAKAVIHESLSNVDLLLPSIEDANTLSGLNDPSDIIDFYHGLGPTQIVLKMGKNGCIVSEKGIKHPIIAHSVGDVVDTTGAGDTFDGALLSRLVDGWSLQNAARYANIAAGLSTSGRGAIPSIPFKDELDRIYADTL